MDIKIYHKVILSQIKRKHNNDRAGSRMMYTYRACAADRESRNYMGFMHGVRAWIRIQTEMEKRQ